jgi:hypothetical protein
MSKVTFLIGDKEVTMDITDERLDSAESIEEVVKSMTTEENE